MRELKKQVNIALKDINQIWVDAISKTSKDIDNKSKNVDIPQVIGKVIDKMTMLDDKFEEAKIRIRDPKYKI